MVLVGKDVADRDTAMAPAEESKIHDAEGPGSSAEWGSHPKAT